MPFITEEMWHYLRERQDGDDLTISSWPEKGAVNEALLQAGNVATDIVSKVRDIRNKQGLGFKEAYPLKVRTANFKAFEPFSATVIKMAKLESYEAVSEDVAGALGFFIRSGWLRSILSGGRCFCRF